MVTLFQDVQWWPSGVRRTLRVWAIAAAMLAGTAAHAQFTHDLFDRPISEQVEHAFAQPYADLLVAEVAEVVRESSGPLCRMERGLDDAGLARAVRLMLIRSGTQMYEKLLAALPRSAFEDALKEKAGDDAPAELARLLEDPDVRAFREIMAPATHATFVTYILEWADRAAVIKRAGLKRRFSPLATGDTRLLDADPTEKAFEAADAFAQKSASDALKRYMELLYASTQAFTDALKSTPAANELGPSAMFPTLEEDLQALCVRQP